LHQDLVECAQVSLLNEIYRLGYSNNWDEPNFFNTTRKNLDGIFLLALKEFLSFGYLKNVELLRSYANLHPAGEFYAGKMHTDDEGGYGVTLLYYPFDWQIEWGGGTEFEDGTIVDYVCNRLLIFDGDINHRALPHTSPHGFRYSVAYKTKAEWE